MLWVCRAVMYKRFGLSIVDTVFEYRMDVIAMSTLGYWYMYVSGDYAEVSIDPDSAGWMWISCDGGEITKDKIEGWKGSCRRIGARIRVWSLLGMFVTWTMCSTKPSFLFLFSFVLFMIQVLWFGLLIVPNLSVFYFLCFFGLYCRVKVGTFG